MRVEGQLVFNSTPQILKAVLDGADPAYLPEDKVCSYLNEGHLVQVLSDWRPSISGYHLYYPSRR